jgi:hypothetical protein
MKDLVNPVWSALNSIDQRLNIGDEEVSYFDSEVSPFVAMQDWCDEAQLNALESYLIYKLNPFYNNHPGQYGQDKLKHVLMLMENNKNKTK